MTLLPSVYACGEEMPSATKHASAAFSLIELLVVIAVIGILVTIGLATLPSITDSSQIAIDQRNAQQIAIMANSADAIGAGPLGTNLDSIISNLASGVTGNIGGSNLPLKLDGMSPDQMQRAQYFLMISTNDGTVIYLQDGP